MKKAELIFVPTPGIGHLIATVELSKLMVDLNPNVSIAVLVVKPPASSPAMVAEFDTLIATTTNSTRINFIYLPQRDDPLFAFAQIQRPYIKEAVANMVRDFSSLPDSPQLAGFVLDMFVSPLVDLANEFGVPSYVFFTSAAASLGFQLCAQALHDEQNVNIVELKDSDIEFNIPSYVNPVSTTLFPQVMFKPESFNFLMDVGRALRKVNGIMINTFSELESHAIHSLSDGRQPPVYPVGPILNIKASTEVDQKCADIMEWLDEQPALSVVFLCFGSMGSFNKDQVKQIAYALEQSGHRFLWSLRRPPVSKGSIVSPTDYENVADVLPEGFLDRTASSGKIIGWAPQAAILGHPSTGGFVSHCGWNSTLESIWFGVPMATWPLYAEQNLNAFKLVKELGIGVEIKIDYKLDIRREDEDIEIVDANKIERGIKCLMEQDSDIRKKAKELSEKSRKALIEGGSSHSYLSRFINDVMDNMP